MVKLYVAMTDFGHQFIYHEILCVFCMYGNNGSAMLSKQFVYCKTLDVVYKSMRHSEKGHIQKKDKVNIK
jgi:hypothetical protein